MTVKARNNPQIILVIIPVVLFLSENSVSIATRSAASPTLRMYCPKFCNYPTPLMKQTMLISSIKQTAPVIASRYPIAVAKS